MSHERRRARADDVLAKVFDKTEPKLGPHSLPQAGEDLTDEEDFLLDLGLLIVGILAILALCAPFFWVVPGF